MALIERSRGLRVSHVLSHRATTDSGAPFLLTHDEEVTFGEVESLAESLAAALSNLGIESGDRVAVVLPCCPEFVVSVFALAKLGAVLVPLSPRLTESELQYRLRHSEAVCAVTVESFHGVDFLQVFEELFPLLPELQYLVTVGEEDLWYDDRIFQFEDLISAGAGRDFDAPEAASTSELFAIVYTSGTTGKPKGVELTHENVVHAAAETVRSIDLGGEDRVIGVTALFHVFGLGPGVLGSVLAGSALILQSEFEPAESLDLIEHHRATVHYGVPTVFAAELREHRTRSRDLSSLRCGLVAGAPLGEELHQRIEEQLCPNLLAAYSLTEAASTVAMTRLDDPVEKRRFTVGRPVDGMRVRVLEQDGTELPVESLGEIAVHGPGVMRGYYRQPKETSGCFDSEGYFRTGDLGIVDDEGYLHLVGRRKEVIIRGGSNVYPREIEDRLHAHPAVQDAAVVGVQDPILGEAVCAAVVPIEGAIVTGEELTEWCRRTLADYKIPDSVQFLDELPMTGTGKVRRAELARLLEAGEEGPSN
ncbi:MAG: class I adenylate-forming enzyme family protein [Gemmatimonadota bacterium]